MTDTDQVTWRNQVNTITAPRDEIEAIIRATAAEHRLSYRDLITPAHFEHIVTARYVAIHRIARRYPRISCVQIGKHFGMDHTSILYALGRLKRRKPRNLHKVLEAA